MDEIAVINASPLILLSRSKKLALLHFFAKKIFVPAPVAQEIAARGIQDITAQSITATTWLEVVAV